MFKKLAALALAILMLCTALTAFTSCAGGSAADLKIGCIMVGDETEGYTKAHMDGIKEAAKALGIADNRSTGSTRSKRPPTASTRRPTSWVRAARSSSPTPTATRTSWCRPRRRIRTSPSSP